MARKSDAAQDAAIDNSSEVQAAHAATDANVTVENVTDAVAAAIANVRQIEAALAVLGDANPAAAALQAALTDANGMLAIEQAEAERQAVKMGEIEQAQAAAVAASLPRDLLAAMLAAIEAKYAPVAPAVEQAAVITATVTGRRAPRAATLARNAEVAADDSAMAVGRQAYAAWQASPDAASALFSKSSGTRYPSFVPLASNGNGVANYADLQRQASAVRTYMRTELGIGGIGNSTAVPTWLAGVGPQFGAGGPKELESGLHQFSDGAAIALYPDGRFRLAANEPDVRFLDSDPAAYALFTASGAQTIATASQRANRAPANGAPTVGTPIVPTAPTVAASASTGKLAKPAHCQHCGARNVVGDVECGTCHDTEWLAD